MMEDKAQTALWAVAEFRMGEWKVDKVSERKPVNKNVVEWIRNRVESKYADDISLVLIYGRELNDAIVFGGRTYDLLSSYRFERLEKLAQKAGAIEGDYVNALKQAGVKLKKYDSFEEFVLRFEHA